MISSELLLLDTTFKEKLHDSTLLIKSKKKKQMKHYCFMITLQAVRVWATHLKGRVERSSCQLQVGSSDAEQIFLTVRHHNSLDYWALGDGRQLGLRINKWAQFCHLNTSQGNRSNPTAKFWLPDLSYSKYSDLCWLKRTNTGNWAVPLMDTR